MEIKGDSQEQIKYAGKMIEIVEQIQVIDGKEKKFEFARRAPGARLIIETNSGKLLLTKEFRYELKDFDYRLPGGKVFDLLTEYNAALASKRDISVDIEKAALKEAKEEVGIEICDIQKFSVSKCGATVEWDLHYFILKNVVQGAQNLEHGENIEVIEVEKEEAEKMCLDGRISEERSAMNLLKYLNSK